MSLEPQPFDPYHEWLGIEPHEQPADFYRLLGLARFESDAGKIARAADEQMALVRTFQTGKRASYTQKLLNELAAARVCLINPEAKAQYDAGLARRLTALEAVRRTIAAAVAPAAGIATPSPPPPHATTDATRNATPTRPRHSLFWQLLAISSALLLACLLAVGGWALVRSRSRGSPTVVTPSSKEKATRSKLATPTERPNEAEPVSLPDSHGHLNFNPTAAKLAGEVQRTSVGGAEALGRWISTDDKATWQFRIERPGYFKAEITYATSSDAEDAELELRINERVRRCSLRPSGGLDQFVTDAYTVAVPASGLHKLTIRPHGEPRGEWLVLRSVRFIPAGANAPAEAP